MAPEPDITVLHTVPKADDLETHVLRVTFDEYNVSVVEVRDYVPSTGKYGHGYWVPLTSVQALGKVLSSIEVDNAARR